MQANFIKLVLLMEWQGLSLIGCAILSKIRYACQILFTKHQHKVVVDDDCDDCGLVAVV